jgi:hypothetical protein
MIREYRYDVLGDRFLVLIGQYKGLGLLVYWFIVFIPFLYDEKNLDVHLRN